MNFFLLESSRITRPPKNVIILHPNSWDDWFRYSTVYNLYYYDDSSERVHLGSIKIGQKKQTERSPQLPDNFTELSENFFSLCQDISYYELLNEFGEEFRDAVLGALNDIAFKPNLFDEVIDESVTRISLLRDVTISSVKGQFRRLALGDAELTPYKFRYIGPRGYQSLELDFSVTPNSNPPTNIHVIIGRNGVGKTHLFNNMISALITGNKTNSKFGHFESQDSTDQLFANLVSVSYSAFDEILPMEEKRDKVNALSYSYIGLRRHNEDKKIITKSPTILKNEFVRNVKRCRAGSKNRKWLNVLNMLETDPIFNDAEVSQIARIPLDDDIKDISENIFDKLSSGHKIILLTLTRLVIAIEEKSLVLLDEPEAYLHPPLLSAFIRALSELLVSRNAVAIIGTHSPVVLQEVPSSCVYTLRRQGNFAAADRLEIESFGENVGMLTQEVFGLEVTESGFHQILKKLVLENETYEDAALILNDQLGFEAQSILRNMFYRKSL